MQVNQDLQTVVTGPTDGAVKVVGLPLDVWFTAGDVICPVADRYSDMVETGS